MATAYRSGWHFIDLATAIPHSGDSLMVTVFGEPVVVTRDEDEDVRAYRCLRRPRGRRSQCDVHSVRNDLCES